VVNAMKTHLLKAELPAFPLLQIYRKVTTFNVPTELTATSTSERSPSVPPYVSLSV